MIELATPSDDETGPLPDAARIPALSDPELDALPFGVIQLSESGIVLRYNLAEARFARLDRSSVLGRKFFEEIAPCTRTDAFMGRVFAFIKASEPLLAFSYLFDFKFGAQQVDVELVRPPAAGSVYLCINRRRFGTARGAEGLTPAPLQNELVAEPSYVARDAFARRLVRIDGSVLSALRTTWGRIAPQGWALFSEEWGKQWGRLAVVDLETMALEETGKSLRELPITDVLARCATLLETAGWGRVIADFSAAQHGVFTLDVEHSAIGESVGVSEVTRCQLLAGFFKALFAHLAQRLLAVSEACCRSQGFARCTFVVAGAERRAQLAKAIENAQGDPQAVLRALIGAP